MADTDTPAADKPKKSPIIITDNPQSAADQFKIANDRITAIETHLKTLEGKPGQNPFIWAKKNKLEDIKLRLAKKDLTAVDAAMKLPATPDCKVCEVEVPKKKAEKK